MFFFNTEHLSCIRISRVPKFMQLLRETSSISHFLFSTYSYLIPTTLCSSCMHVLDSHTQLARTHANSRMMQHAYTMLSHSDMRSQSH
jgi:hypothetical protein